MIFGLISQHTHTQKHHPNIFASNYKVQAVGCLSFSRWLMHDSIVKQSIKKENSVGLCSPAAPLQFMAHSLSRQRYCCLSELRWIQNCDVRLLFQSQTLLKTMDLLTLIVAQKISRTKWKPKSPFFLLLLTHKTMAKLLHRKRKQWHRSQLQTNDSGMSCTDNKHSCNRIVCQ